MLTIKTPERRQWRRSGVFDVKFEHILHLVLGFLLLTLNMKLTARKANKLFQNHNEDIMKMLVNNVETLFGN